MSSGEGLDSTRLEELFRRFDHAACEYPSVDAVVVYRPDLLREEAERQGRILYYKTAEPVSEEWEFAHKTKAEHAGIRYAFEWESWVTPEFKSIEQLGGQTYWTRVIRSNEYPEFPGPPNCSKLWKCRLFGQPAREFNNAPSRLFSVLAMDSAQLILSPCKLEGTSLLSRWLIHLADRPEPIIPDSRRRYLSWPESANLRSPTWVPVTPQNSPTSWWAVRLPNVFRLSRAAIQQAIGNAPVAVLTDEDKTILSVLYAAGRALIFSKICMEAAKLVREKGGASAREAGLVTLSETKVRERVPILESLGLVLRPQGPKGRPTSRKGIGITDKGRAWLENQSSLDR